MMMMMHIVSVFLVVAAAADRELPYWLCFVFIYNRSSNICSSRIHLPLQICTKPAAPKGPEVVDEASLVEEAAALEALPPCEA